MSSYAGGELILVLVLDLNLPNDIQILHALCSDNLSHKYGGRLMISEYRTRNHRGLQILKTRVEYAKRSFYFSSVENWNDIYGNIPEQESLARFKKRFRAYLQNLPGPNMDPFLGQQFYFTYLSFSSNCNYILFVILLKGV